jgi:hypothetical protein
LSASIANGINLTADPRALAVPRVLTPPISLVRSPRIEGVDAFADQVLASTTPTVSWTAPSIGRPTQYSIRVYEVFAVPALARTQTRRVATVYTPNTSFQLPPGILESGRHYAVSVDAINAPTGSNAPFRSVLDFARSYTTTGLLTVP